jgi:hypothetical protein
MTVVEMTASVEKIIRKEVRARLLLDFLRNKFIEDQVAVTQNADRHEAGCVRVVRGHLSQIEVVEKQEGNQQKRFAPAHRRLC